MAKEELPEAGKSHGTEKKTAIPTNVSSKPKAVSVYLSNKDKHTLEKIAQKNNVKRHMLLSYAVRYFLANYRAGHITLDPTIEAGKVVLNVHIALDDNGAFHS